MDQGGKKILFDQYIKIVNNALIRNSEKLLYKQLIDAMKKEIGDEPLTVGVYDSSPDEHYDFYTILLKEGIFKIIEQERKKN